jgi:iron(III) transport system substrate-binding protein
MQLGLALASIGVATSLVAQHMYALPSYAFMAKDYVTQAALYTHHQYIAGFLMVGAFAHGAIFFAATAAAAAPVLAEEVNVYSYRQPELIKPLTDAFTAETGVKVNVAYLKKGMIERLEAEGDRSPADMVLTVDISRLAGVVNAGLTQPVVSEAINENVPAQYRDPENHWFGLTTRARIVYASKDRVADGEVTTYEDLADPKWAGRICTRSGTNAYNVALTSAMIEHHGEEGAKTWLEGVKANLARKPQGNDRAQVKAIWAGECDISVGNTYYMGKMLNDEEQKEWADSVRIVFPTFENAGTHVNVSGVALTKSAPNKENAIKMMEFLASPKAQEIYAKANYEYPIAPGTEADALVQGWGEFTADDVNLMTLAGHRSQALKITEQVDFDG